MTCAEYLAKYYIKKAKADKQLLNDIEKATDRAIRNLKNEQRRNFKID